MTPEEMMARLLYRDGLMLVIDKPAGFAVHKGPKGGESLEDHFGALRFGLPRAPALAHRLDRDTSGCLVLGRHRKALAELGRLFKAGSVGKTYWALVEGGPTLEEGSIDLPLGRKDATRGWWMKHDPDGQSAVTTWKVLGRAAGVPSPACGGGSGWGQAANAGADSNPLPNPPPQAGGSDAPHLVGAGAAHRPHPSVAGALRGDGLADPRRQHLWNGAACRRPRSASACPRGGGAALQESRSHSRHRAGAAAHARSHCWPADGRAKYSSWSTDQYNVASSRAGAARSCSGPPILPWVKSARMAPALGRLLRSTWRVASHSFERTIALAH